MGRLFEWEISSDLQASTEQLWRHMSAMGGVNQELAPWVRMTTPQAVAARSLADAAVGEVVFRSYLLALGVAPFDLHSVSFERIEVEKGFVEQSHSLLQRRWRHERALAPLPGGGCRLTDRLQVQPRLPLVRVLVGPLVRRLFQHRHRWLRQRFG